MDLTWTALNNFSTTYKVSHGGDTLGNEAHGRLKDQGRFKTKADPLLANTKEKENDNFLTISQIGFSKPQSKNKNFSLLNTNSSGFTKNNLNNDGLTYYHDRKVESKDKHLTEYRNRFRPFR